MSDAKNNYPASVMRPDGSGGTIVPVALSAQQTIAAISGITAGDSAQLDLQIAGDKAVYIGRGSGNTIKLDVPGKDIQLAGQSLLPVIVQKTGTNTGDYGTISTTYVDIDAVNLSHTTTIPVGQKLIIRATGQMYSPNYQAFVSLVKDAIVMAEQYIASPQIGTFSLCWVFAGDGIAHTWKLQYKTSNAAGYAYVFNGTHIGFPVMMFETVTAN